MMGLRRHLRSGFLLLIVLLVLAACGQPVLNPSAQASAHPAPVADGPRAQPFSVATLEGDTFTLAEHPGHPVVLFFAASWCASCYAEAQGLAQLERIYGARGVRFLVLDVDPTSTVEDLRRFKDIAGLMRSWALDKDNAVTRAYQVRTLDTTVVIDAEGRIVYRDEVSTPPATLQGILDRLLQ